MTNFAEVISVVVAVLFAPAAGQCPPVTIEKLGDVDAPSTRGLVAASYARDNISFPLVQVFQMNIVCFGGAAAKGRYGTLSVVVNYSCAGEACGREAGINLAQLELHCEAKSARLQWLLSAVALDQPRRQIPATATLETPPRYCALCTSSFDLHQVPVDETRHCVGKTEHS